MERETFSISRCYFFTALRLSGELFLQTAGGCVQISLSVETKPGLELSSKSISFPTSTKNK